MAGISYKTMEPASNPNKGTCKECPCHLPNSEESAPLPGFYPTMNDLLKKKTKRENFEENEEAENEEAENEEAENEEAENEEAENEEAENEEAENEEAEEDDESEDEINEKIFDKNLEIDNKEYDVIIAQKELEILRLKREVIVDQKRLNRCTSKIENMQKEIDESPSYEEEEIEDDREAEKRIETEVLKFSNSRKIAYQEKKRKNLQASINIKKQFIETKKKLLKDKKISRSFFVEQRAAEIADEKAGRNPQEPKWLHLYN